MADKVHPVAGEDATPAAAALVPPPSYVIQVPKDQIYRYPPPENAHKYNLYVRRAKRRRRSCCCRLLVCTASFLAALALAAAIATAAIYFVFHPEIPRYSVDAVSVRGFAGLASQPAKPFAPEIDVTVTAENPNGKIGIYYRGGSSIRASYSGVDLCGGAWPAFYHGPGNTTKVRAALTGPMIELSQPMRGELRRDERAGAVPLRIDVRVPVRVKVGKATTWTITVKARCAVTVNGLTPAARVVSKKCGVRVKLF